MLIEKLYSQSTEREREGDVCVGGGGKYPHIPEEDNWFNTLLIFWIYSQLYTNVETKK